MSEQDAGRLLRLRGLHQQVREAVAGKGRQRMDGYGGIGNVRPNLLLAEMQLEAAIAIVEEVRALRQDLERLLATAPPAPARRRNRRPDGQTP